MNLECLDHPFSLIVRVLECESSDPGLIQAFYAPTLTMYSSKGGH